MLGCLRLDNARDELRSHTIPRTRSERQRQWRRNYTIFNDLSQSDVGFRTHALAFANATTFWHEQKDDHAAESPSAHHQANHSPSLPCPRLRDPWFNLL